MKADLLILPKRLLVSDRYRKTTKAMSSNSENDECTQALGKKVASMLPEKPELADCTGVPLHFFHFARLIYDEAHENTEMHDHYLDQSLRNLEASRRWAFTGTPPLTCGSGMSILASMLRVHVTRIGTGAQRFADFCMRRGSWERDIPVERSEVFVELTAAELLMYEEAKRGAEFMGSRYNEHSLQLCTHHSVLHQGLMETAQSVIQRMDRDISSCLDRIATLRVTLAQQPSSGVAQAAMQRTQEKLKEVQRSKAFFVPRLEALRLQNDTAEELRGDNAERCSVCMDTGNLVMTNGCFHHICQDCAVTARDQLHRCPVCRDPLRGFVMDWVMSSKIKAIVDRAKECIGRNEKVLAFARWDRLTDKVFLACKTKGVHCMKLQGSARHMAKVLAEFRSDGKPGVLFLSSEKSPSGMTLVEANVIFLIHPLLSEHCQQQILGRVIRPGQTKSIQLVSFVAKGTIEVDLHREGPRLAGNRSLPVG